MDQFIGLNKGCSRNRGYGLEGVDCCFNRPYDDQTYKSIHLETEAKLYIQDCIKKGSIELVWSFILDFENSVNPYKERKEAIKEWRLISVHNVKASDTIRNYGKDIESTYKLKPKDALHLACAIEAQCEYLLTTDKFFIRKTSMLDKIIVINPLDFISILEER